MKKVLGILLFGLLLTSPSFAAQLTATMGDYNASGIYRISCDINGVCTYAQDTGIVLPYTTATTTTTLTASQTGTTLVVTPVAGNTRVNLPAATVGLNFTVVDDAAFSLAVYPFSGETINFASLSASQGLVNSSTPAKGDHLSLFCATAGKWSVKSMRNTWVAAN